MFIRISISSQQVSRILFLTTLLFLVPFSTADLAIIYTQPSLCFQEGFRSVTINPYSYLLLGTWMKQDGFIKLGIIAIGLFFVRMRVELKENKLLLPAYANILTLYWLFNIAWNVVGGVIYWHYVHSILCTDQVNAYTQAVLITNYVISPIGLIISRIRPTFESQLGNTRQAPRRNTEMVATVIQ